MPIHVRRGVLREKCWSRNGSCVMEEHCVYVYMKNVREGRRLMYRKFKVWFLVLLNDARTNLAASYICSWWTRTDPVRIQPAHATVCDTGQPYWAHCLLLFVSPSRQKVMNRSWSIHHHLTICQCGSQPAVINGLAEREVLLSHAGKTVRMCPWKPLFVAPIHLRSLHFIVRTELCWCAEDNCIAEIFHLVLIRTS